MQNKLKPIIAQKQQEVTHLYRTLDHDANKSMQEVLDHASPINQRPSFKTALMKDQLSVIAEIKRHSPSKGTLAKIDNPVTLAERYIAGGASALSILTDQRFFSGNICDLQQVADYIHKNQLMVPIIQKDFIIDPIQIAQAHLAGASAVLCIMSVLANKVEPLLQFAHSLNMDVLVEVHTLAELNIALACGANIVGINNRDLNTFMINTEHALNMISAIPTTIISVAESGITQPSLAKQYYSSGYDAVLIGEALVKTSHPDLFIKACLNE